MRFFWVPPAEAKYNFVLLWLPSLSACLQVSVSPSLLKLNNIPSYVHVVYLSIQAQAHNSFLMSVITHSIAVVLHTLDLAQVVILMLFPFSSTDSLLSSGLTFKFTVTPR